MRIYFTASISGKPSRKKDYDLILDTLKSQGATIIADHIMQTDATDIEQESPQDRIAFQNQLEEWILDADAVIAEVSHPSTSVGYEISLAVQKKKPTLLLYTNAKPPSLLAQYKTDDLVCERYTKITLPTILESFLRFAKDAPDFRFTFFLPSDLNDYLEETAEKNGVSKAAYVRLLISRDRDKPR